MFATLHGLQAGDLVKATNVVHVASADTLVRLHTTIHKAHLRHIRV